jgi:hypothetical protein
MDLGREVLLHRNLFTLMKSFNALFIVYCHIFFKLHSLGNYNIINAKPYILTTVFIPINLFFSNKHAGTGVFDIVALTFFFVLLCCLPYTETTFVSASFQDNVTAQFTLPFKSTSTTLVYTVFHFNL